MVKGHQLRVVCTSSGSDQSRSHTRPRSGTSSGRSISRSCSTHEYILCTESVYCISLHLVEVLQVWREASVHAQDGVLD